MSVEPASCVSPDSIVAFLRGELDRDHARAIEAHMDACPDCLALVAAMAKSPVCRREPEPPLSSVDDRDAATASRLGHYLLIEEVGRGGMGVVHRAYDPRLGREVAIKVLRNHDIEAKTRMLREARALAQLSHPNVVPVFDVHEDGQRLYMALEYVEGHNMRQWLRAQPRSWRDIVRVFREAGKGLAAAHRAGLVHRDFKPSNVMVGADERVRVMDFGLARASVRTDPPSAGSWDPPLDAPDVLGGPLTEHGIVLGTPVYMAPEQLDGHPADHRSDQFALCVSLYEAFYGGPPLSRAELYAVLKGTPRPAIRRPETTAVPRWLHAVVERGLAVDPEQRWPSIDALLDALTRDPAMRWRRRLQVTGVAGLVIGGGAGVWWSASNDRDACAGSEALLAEIWNDDRREAVRNALLATELPFSATTAARVTERFDDYAHRWISARRDACIAAHADKEVSPEMLDRQNACFARHRIELRTLVDALSGEIDVAMAESATMAARSLPAIEACARPELVDAGLAPPEDAHVRSEVASTRDELARIRGRMRVKEDAEHAAELEPIVDRARATSYGPVLAEALLLLGEARMPLDSPESTRATLEEAYFVAIDSGHDLVALDASSALIWAIGYRAARPAEAEEWIRAARAWSHRGSVNAQHEYRAKVLTYVAVVRMLEQRWDEVARMADEALEAFEQVEDPSPREHSRAMESRAWADAWLGHPEQALARFDRVVAMRERAFGSDHPSTALARINRAQVLDRLGRPEETAAEARRAIAIVEATYGDAHADLPALYLLLGNGQRQLDDARAAQMSVERAVALLRTSGGRSTQLVHALTMLSTVERERGELERARRAVLEALALLERAEDPGAPPLWLEYGTLLAELGERAEARVWLERAVAGYEHPDADPQRRGLAQYQLARVLWDSPADRQDALRLARAALDGVSGREEERAEIQAWLSAHERGSSP
jgi:tetratricopeptide (TPR) repeat protein